MPRLDPAWWKALSTLRRAGPAVRACEEIGIAHGYDLRNLDKQEKLRRAKGVGEKTFLQILELSGAPNSKKCPTCGTYVVNQPENKKCFVCRKVLSDDQESWSTRDFSGRIFVTHDGVCERRLDSALGFLSGNNVRGRYADFEEIVRRVNRDIDLNRSAP